MTNFNNIMDTYDEDDSEVIQRPARKLRDPAADAAMPVFKTLTATDLDNLPDPSWLVDHVLTEDGFAVIYGPPGATKSFAAIDMALSICAGVPFHGANTQKGPVLYAIGEGIRGLKYRIESWKLAHPEADADDIEANFHVIPLAPRLLEKEQAGMLINTATELAEVTGLKLVIVDTWARALTGGDENSAGDAGVAVDILDTLRRKTGATTLVVHHSGADGTRERGSTALRAAADTSIAMLKNEQDGIISFICKKQKDAEPFKTVKFCLQSYGHSVVLARQPDHAGVGQYPSTPTRSPRDYAAEAAQRKLSPF
jgi:hypothetical protein